MLLLELKKHPVAYPILLLTSIVFVWLFFQVWPNRATERVLIMTYGVWYFAWGVITHRSKQTLSNEVIKEYGLVAILGAILLLLLTF